MNLDAVPVGPNPPWDLNVVIEIPQGMFAMAIASASLPTLARLRSEQKHAELLSLFHDSLRLTLFIALPASAALFALSADRSAFLSHLFGRPAPDGVTADASAADLLAAFSRMPAEEARYEATLDAALAYVVMALLLSVWINAARNRRRAAMPRRERRRASFPLQHSH